MTYIGRGVMQGKREEGRGEAWGYRRWGGRNSPSPLPTRLLTLCFWRPYDAHGGHGDPDGRYDPGDPGDSDDPGGRADDDSADSDDGADDDVDNGYGDYGYNDDEVGDDDADDVDCDVDDETVTMMISDYDAGGAFSDGGSYVCAENEAIRSRVQCVGVGLERSIVRWTVL